MEYLEKRIHQAQEAIEKSEYVLIGGGAGLSTAAGLTYSGKRFRMLVNSLERNRNMQIS